MELASLGSAAFRSNQWVLDLDLESMRLEHSVAGRRTVVCEIARSEAGELEIETIVDRRLNRAANRAGEWLSLVAGRSVDGKTSFILPEQGVSTGGLLGHMDEVHVGRALLSWWPVNSRSRDGLRQFEGCRDGYWNPSGLSTGPRVTNHEMPQRTG